MTVLCGILGLGTLITSAVFFTGFGLQWIPGWKLLSTEEKSKINSKKLSRNISIIFFLVSCIFLISGISPLFLEKYFLWSMIFWMVITSVDAYWISKTTKIMIK